MNRTRAAYVATTALFCIGITPGAVLDIAQPAFVVEAMQLIQLPMYLITLVGIWKLLGVVALAMPRFRRINEWAYAGFFFDLTGAAYCHAAAGDTVASILTPAVFLVPLMASYALRERVSRPAGAAVGAPAMG